MRHVTLAFIVVALFISVGRFSTIAAAACLSAPVARADQRGLLMRSFGDQCDVGAVAFTGVPTAVAVRATNVDDNSSREVL